MKNINFKIYVLLLALFSLATACKEKTYEIPTPSDKLQNDLIKRSLGPNIVGGTIEFAYAAGIIPENGKLVSMSVEASIAGATGTYMDNKFYSTSNTGTDVGTAVGNPSVTTGKTTLVTYTGDFSASTLRYFYVIPEAARGQSINFTFTATASNGETISYKAGPYQVRNMDMVLDLVAKDGTDCYLSIADMKVYNATYAAANPNSIDLVYLYRALPTVTYLHSLVAPTADPIYLPGITLPTTLKNKSKIVKAFTVRDQQLARIQYGLYVDDIDLSSIDFTNAPDFGINLKAEAGIWVQTADGRYNAYVYINNVNNTTKEMRLSIKRLKVK